MYNEFIIGEGVEFNSELNVPFVPTDEVIVESMLDLAGVNAQDLLYDLGSGDGRIVVGAAMGRETRAVGVDMDPQRLEEGQEFATSMGMDHLVEFIEDDFFDVNLSDATVVTMYLLQSINLLLRPKLLTELKPGTRIVSHSFDMGEWQPDDKCFAAGSDIFKWVVPANVAGVWAWQAGGAHRFKMALTQKFQRLGGRVWLNEAPIKVTSAILSGTQVTLTLLEDDGETEHRFNWRLKDNQLQTLDDTKAYSHAIRA
ncbi:methyltransferase domain-containing protein [Oceanisphaera pacifica]|uniref:Class I SAM-dependent methyltransferase n=1 Tax=Oceanisphaera pacifica TaxID=2818389 RepID=A0ABS3NG16_9GAMM|nr:methyltransferase domain-containing protein [Oceanisphaera pacifica]MBO1519519.1 class I SAM-dependent methyltransferase [Oceanisphaera pacifica]